MKNRPPEMEAQCFLMGRRQSVLWNVGWHQASGAMFSNKASM